MRSIFLKTENSTEVAVYYDEVKEASLHPSNFMQVIPAWAELEEAQLEGSFIKEKVFRFGDDQLKVEAISSLMLTLLSQLNGITDDLILAKAARFKRAFINEIDEDNIGVAVALSTLAAQENPELAAIASVISTALTPFITPTNEN